MAAAAVLMLAPACGARTDLPCFDEPCPSPDEEDLRQADACEVALAQPPPCTGSGLIDTLEDVCIDDGGNTASGDVLEIFCVEGMARFCLSHEQCPWRADPSAGGEATCSPSGLASSFMARTIHGCAGWQGQGLFCCSSDGRIGVTPR